jgi:hypothetical protein
MSAGPLAVPTWRCMHAQEWITPQPSRRPDIFPEFDKQATPMPKPMPGDPELPDEEVRAWRLPGALHIARAVVMLTASIYTMRSRESVASRSWVCSRNEHSVTSQPCS